MDTNIPHVVDQLEAALAKLEQAGDAQDNWDQVANAFQFLADSAREGMCLDCMKSAEAGAGQAVIAFHIIRLHGFSQWIGYTMPFIGRTL